MRREGIVLIYFVVRTPPIFKNADRISEYVSLVATWKRKHVNGK
jgi:hypothetical protein